MKPWPYCNIAFKKMGNYYGDDKKNAIQEDLDFIALGHLLDCPI